MSLVKVSSTAHKDGYLGRAQAVELPRDDVARTTAMSFMSNTLLLRAV